MGACLPKAWDQTTPPQKMETQKGREHTTQRPLGIHPRFPHFPQQMGRGLLDLAKHRGSRREHKEREQREQAGSTALGNACDQEARVAGGREERQAGSAKYQALAETWRSLA